MSSIPKTDVVVRVPAELHRFDPLSGIFLLQDAEVTASIAQTSNQERLYLSMFSADDDRPAFGYEPP
jgi:hypothetical protein